MKIACAPWFVAGALLLAACGKETVRSMAVAIGGGDDVLVTVGSPPDLFPRNIQCETALAYDPTRPWIVAAGAIDFIDAPPCRLVGNTCSNLGAGNEGVYFSLDGAQSWTQPTYSGWSARTPPAGVGPIGTIPNYYENGMTTRSDPAFAFGPRPGPAGFSWAGGARLYRLSNTVASTDPPAFPGPEATTVSWTDDVAAAAAGDQSAWSAPVVATRQTPETSSDKPELWVDNAASSAFFGNVYECNIGALVTQSKAFPEPIVFSRSTDGGASWEHRQVSPADDPIFHNERAGGRSFCTIRTDSAGVVYVFFSGATESRDLVLLARSFDGGGQFRAARTVVARSPCGRSDPTGFQTFDGIGGTRTNSFPNADIANGAPTGAGATDEIALAFCDAAAGVGHERALVMTSTDRGETWSAPADAAAPADRPALVAVAISPNGADVYVGYDAFLTGWQTDTSQPRPFQGVVRHARATDLGAWTELHRGPVGDARATSRAPLDREFVADYIAIAATNDGVYAAWLDGRNAEDCPAIDAYRASLATATPLPVPDPLASCPPGFGNLDVYAGFYAP